MGAIELREYIKLQLETADERVLRIVASVFDSYEEPVYRRNDEILGLLAESELDYKAGNVVDWQSVLDESRKKFRS